jgi:xanthine dehydrogenase molybdopterin-binding subunit B
VGEPPFVLAISVGVAAKSAISSLSPGRSAPLSFPVTSEELLKYLSALDKDENCMSLTSASVPIVQDHEDNTRAANEV